LSSRVIQRFVTGVLSGYRTWRPFFRPAADQRPPGPPGADTPEITFDDPDGFTVQIQDVSYCGGVGPLGNICA
jgi:hypothetical protein